MAADAGVEAGSGLVRAAWAGRCSRRWPAGAGPRSGRGRAAPPSPSDAMASSHCRFAEALAADQEVVQRGDGGLAGRPAPPRASGRRHRRPGQAVGAAEVVRRGRLGSQLSPPDRGSSVPRPVRRPARGSAAGRSSRRRPGASRRRDRTSGSGRGQGPVVVGRLRIPGVDRQGLAGRVPEPCSRRSPVPSSNSAASSWACVRSPRNVRNRCRSAQVALLLLARRVARGAARSTASMVNLGQRVLDPAGRSSSRRRLLA